MFRKYNFIVFNIILFINIKLYDYYLIYKLRIISKCHGIITLKMYLFFLINFYFINYRDLSFYRIKYLYNYKCININIKNK